MKIQDLATIDRPREKLILKGVENMKDTELLAILFRTGMKGKDVLELSEELLRMYKKKDLIQVTYKELTEIPGIDSSKACTLLAALEFSRRVLQLGDQTLPTVEAPEDALQLLSEIRAYKKEHFVTLYLNARNQVIHKETISIGTLNASLVHPREVFEPAVRILASTIILSHNHPSGHVEPSDADITVTKRMVEAGKLMGIEVMDHLIIAPGRYYSFRGEGKL